MKDMKMKKVLENLKTQKNEKLLKLNIKKIMAEYSMPFDPAVWPEIGRSAAYTIIRYESIWLAAGLGSSIVLLAVCSLLRRKKAV